MDCVEKRAHIFLVLKIGSSSHLFSRWSIPMNANGESEREPKTRKLMSTKIKTNRHAPTAANGIHEEMTTVSAMAIIVLHRFRSCTNERRKKRTEENALVALATPVNCSHSKLKACTRKMYPFL